MMTGYNDKRDCICLYQLSNIYIIHLPIYSIEKPSIYQSRNTNIVIIMLGALSRCSYKYIKIKYKIYNTSLIYFVYL